MMTQENTIDTASTFEDDRQTIAETPVETTKEGEAAANTAVSKVTKNLQGSRLPDYLELEVEKLNYSLGVK
jgi:hypothetical protein